MTGHVRAALAKSGVAPRLTRVTLSEHLNLEDCGHVQLRLHKSRLETAQVKTACHVQLRLKTLRLLIFYRQLSTCNYKGMT